MRLGFFHILDGLDHLLFLLALLLPLSTYAQEASPKTQTIDDRQIRARFEKELGQLKDDGKTDGN